MSGARLTGFTGHPKGEEKSGLAVGIDKGTRVTKRELGKKPSYRKGVRCTPPCPRPASLGAPDARRWPPVGEAIAGASKGARARD